MQMEKGTDIQRIAFLITRYLAHIITRQESTELENWLEASDSNQLVFAEILLSWNIKRSVSTAGNDNLYPASYANKL
ncbi:MAG: hypothetical protein JST09_18365 [Bacteroidetes bacterium]|nr:hypothetical protein [Bacteroidota bacterium]